MHPSSSFSQFEPIKSYAELSEGDYIVKEHFEEFKNQDDMFSKQTAGRSFNFLIDTVAEPYVRTLVRHQEPDPYPGLVISRRAKLALPPYPKTAADTDYRSLRLAAFAIQAKTLITARDSLHATLKPGKVRDYTLAFIGSLSANS